MRSTSIKALAAAGTASLRNVILHVDWNQASIDSNKVCRDGEVPGDYVQWTPMELTYLHDWNVIYVPDGKDFQQIAAAHRKVLTMKSSQPTAIVYRTVKGWKYEPAKGDDKPVRQHAVSCAASGVADGVVYVWPGSNVALLCVYAMPQLEQGKTYQAWLVQDGKRTSAGTFNVNRDGYGVLLINSGKPVSEYQQLGITVEPAGGSPAPTTPRVIGGNL